MQKKRYIKGLLSSAICLLVLLACNSRQLTESEYRSWLSTNKKTVLTRGGTVGDLTYELTYLPPDIHRLDSTTSRHDPSMSQKQFLLSISAPQNQQTLRYQMDDPEEYYQRLSYYAFEANHDVLLTSGTDTVQATDVHLVRTYGVKPQLELLVVFAAASDEEAFTVHFLDRVYTEQWLYFRYTKESLKSIPRLKS